MMYKIHLIHVQCIWCNTKQDIDYNLGRYKCTVCQREMGVPQLINGQRNINGEMVDFTEVLHYKFQAIIPKTKLSKFLTELRNSNKAAGHLNMCDAHISMLDNILYVHFTLDHAFSFETYEFKNAPVYRCC